MASECAPPAATTDHDAPAGPETSMGDDVVTVELVPSWPLEFKPHAHSVPSDRMATVWFPELLADARSHSSGEVCRITTGEDTEAILSLPICPEVPSPHA